MTDVNECISEPCLNNGLCVETVHGPGYEWVSLQSVML